MNIRGSVFRPSFNAYFHVRVRERSGSAGGVFV